MCVLRGGGDSQKNKIRGRNKATKNIRKLKKQLQCRHMHSYITVSVVEFTVNELSAPIKSDVLRLRSEGRGERTRYLLTARNTQYNMKTWVKIFFFFFCRIEVRSD